MSDFFNTRIEFLKGVGPQKAEIINKELSIFTYGDLIQHYPFRYEDRSKIYAISELTEDMPFVQIRGQLRNISMVGSGRGQRLAAQLFDGTETMDLVWFQGVQWVSKHIKPHVEYLVYGKPSLFNRKFSIAHPELEPFTETSLTKGLEPVYHTTEKLKRKYVDSKLIAKAIRSILDFAGPHISETLPEYLTYDLDLASKSFALRNIHFPKSPKDLETAKQRLKFEELFYVQLKLLNQKLVNQTKTAGAIYKDASLLTDFYNHHLPFDLTNAQKRVIKEIYRDLGSGRQMNRLLQGDVGSGKTIVGFICMLIAIGNGSQTCLMAPTEILADQHFKGLKEFADKLDLPIALLTGSTKQKDRKPMLEALEKGELKIIVGTHALLEDVVKFQNLGLVIIDEQHRFGVAQRAKLWNKNKTTPPHILVMTATPIPRTLAMTLYGDLDISSIDELPAGRKPIKTVHMYDKDRLKVFGFIRKQIEEGRQIYIVYPLIEESETLDLKDLMDGYESIARAFPEYPLSIVHGKMKAKDKEYEMARFVKGETKIMVATTVIEVGVNVPNASVMVIENAERFGLSQLHQLRGRVGRGADQSYCILMTGYKISKDSRVRIETMVRTNNGFEIADVDLKLRGPGDMAGTKQSGALDLLIADLSQDSQILVKARNTAMDVIERDPLFNLPEHVNINRHLSSLSKNVTNWSRIS